MPFANWKGASAGMIASHVIILFVTFGHLTIDKKVEFLETSIAGCTNESFSSGIVKPTSPMFISLAQRKPIEVSSWLERNEVISTTQPSMVDNSHFPQNVFSISYMYYSLFGTIITVVVGIVVSLLTRSKADAYDSKYIHPCVYRMSKWFPGYEKLFSNEDSNETSNIKTSSLKTDEPVEQHYNQGFDKDSEIITSQKDKSTIGQAFERDQDTVSVKFKSNIIYKSELEIPRTENYKKLSEDMNVN